MSSENKIKIEEESKEQKPKKVFKELIGGEINTEHRGRLLFETIYREGIDDPLIFAVYSLDNPSSKITFETELTDIKGVHYRPPLAFVESFEYNIMKTATDIEEYDSTEELWKEGSKLLADYCALDKEINFISTWAMFYLSVWDRFDTSMNIIIRGAHGKGKSRLQDMFRWMPPRTLNACVASTIAVLFRISAGLKPLILFDELTLNPKNPNFDDFVAIWNAGFRAESGVIRNESKGGLKYKLKFFELHSPKIAILKGASPEQAFESRCLVITMPPGDNVAWELYARRRAEGVDILELGDDFKERAVSFRNKLLLWRFKNWDRLKITGEFVLPGQASMRLFQVLNPMLTVINNEKDNARLFRYAQKGEKMRKGDETPELYIAVFKLIWKRLMSPFKDLIELKTLLSELIEQSSALGIEDVYKVSPQKLGYIVKHKLYLDTMRTGNGLRVIADFNSMINLASDLGVRSFIEDDVQELIDTNRLAERDGFKRSTIKKKKKKKKKNTDQLEIKDLNI